MNLNSFPVPKHLEIVVSSYGGVGTTFLMGFLSRYKKINDPVDKDRLKHSSIPPISINPKQKFIYIYGDPVYATISLFRRDYHRPQSKKNQRDAGNLYSPIPKDMSLEEYADIGIDKFNFRNHFFNWYDSKFYNPVLFLRYESLFDNLETVKNFVDLPLASHEDFPYRKKRESRQTNISAHTMEQLKNMHSLFSKELQALPDVEIRDGKRRSFTGKLPAISLFYVTYARCELRTRAQHLYMKNKPLHL